MKIGQQMYDLAKRLFPIYRSITGEGVRETLAILQGLVPQMEIHAVPSGSQAFDWTVPKEWNIRDAFIANLQGDRLIDIQKNNLHILGYSTPVDRVVTREELCKIVYTLPQQPDYIPYVTSYYKERYGFCMSERQKQSLTDTHYRIYIDSDLQDGCLNYGEIILKGETAQEVFLSTYVCHPSMANNELSGPCVAIHLVKWLLSLPSRRYTYRVIFIPETIGSIVYLSRNLEGMKKNIVAGFNLTCIGDERCYSYLPSRKGGTLADRAARNVLRDVPGVVNYTFLERGSDERQYCSPGVDLPFCSIMRSKYARYPEYHTSADDMSLISPAGLEGSYTVFKRCLTALENNYVYAVNCLCEPQLGKRGLYPDMSRKGSSATARAMMNFLAYCDGSNDLIGISDIIQVPVDKLLPIVSKLKEAGLIRDIGVGDNHA